MWLSSSASLFTFAEDDRFWWIFWPSIGQWLWPLFWLVCRLLLWLAVGWTRWFLRSTELLSCRGRDRMLAERLESEPPASAWIMVSTGDMMCFIFASLSSAVLKAAVVKPMSHCSFTYLSANHLQLSMWMSESEKNNNRKHDWHLECAQLKWGSINSLRSTRKYTCVDLLDVWGRHASILACQLNRFVIEQH